MSNPEPRDRLMVETVLQFLHARGMPAAAREVERAAGLPEGAAECVDPGHPALLEAALDLWAEHRRAEEAKAPEAASGAAAAGAEDLDGAAALGTGRGQVRVAGDRPEVAFGQAAELAAGGNAIAARFARDGDRTLLAVGGASREVQVAELGDEGGAPVAWRHAGAAPVLSLDFQPGAGGSRLAAGYMNGSVAVLAEGGEEAVSLRDHAKYVTQVRYSPDGALLATGSHDGTVRVYAAAGAAAEAAGGLEFRHEFRLPGPVESVAWLLGGASPPVLAVSARDDNYVHLLDAEAGRAASRFNMNALGDDHVSFTAMSLVSSADGRLLLAATDRSRTILFGSHSGRQVRNLYGASNDSYSHARAVFGPSGGTVYGTSQDGHSLLAWDLGTERVVARHPGAHAGVVRDLDAHPARPCLATASFDRTARVWEGCP